jgi:lactoylglutathione lyase
MIRVGNLESALDFFCDKLGLIETNRYDNENGRFSLIFLAAQGDLESAKTNKAPLIELTHNWDEHEYDSGRNFGHLAYRVENIYEYCQKLLDKGVIINRPPRDGHMAFIKSPDGISIELLQRGENLPPQEPWLSMENTGSW